MIETRNVHTEIDLAPYERRLWQAFPCAEKVVVAPFDFGERYGAAVQYSETQRYAVRVNDLADFDVAIDELRDWFAA